MLKLPRLFTYVPSEKGCLTEPSWEINNKKVLSLISLPIYSNYPVWSIIDVYVISSWLFNSACSVSETNYIIGIVYTKQLYLPFLGSEQELRLRDYKDLKAYMNLSSVIIIWRRVWESNNAMQ